MLHVRVTAPHDACDQAVAAVDADPTTTNLVVIPGVALSGHGDLLQFDVARENANAVVAALKALGIVETGSISLSDPLLVLSDSAVAAEAAAPGHPSDAVVWDHIGDQAEGDARLSWSYLAFLILATLIAAVGRYLDQPILIIGAMVVGPEFAPVAAICFAIVRRRPHILRPAITTLLGGFAIAAAVAWLLGLIAYALGWITFFFFNDGVTT